MNKTFTAQNFGGLRRLLWLAALALGCILPSGCAAFHPIQGVPARYLPEEFRGASRAGKRTIDLSLLKQTKSGSHLVDAGDVLAIYVEGVLGDRKLPQPVNIPVGSDVPASFGFPIPVREDGAISLPLIGSVAVRGKTVSEVEELVRKGYTVDRQLLNPENDRILVSLQRPRNYRVLVIRQESAMQQNFAAVGQLNLGAMKRGTGQLVSLPAYKNDVLHALAQTGGLPGLDAENAIYVIRRRKSAQGWTPAPNSSMTPTPAPVPIPSGAEARRVTKRRTVVRAQSPHGNNWPPQSPAVRDANPQGDYRRGGPPPNSYSTPPFALAPNSYTAPPAAVDSARSLPLPVTAAENAVPALPEPATSNSSWGPLQDVLDPASMPAQWQNNDAIPVVTPETADAVMMTPEQFGFDLNDHEMNDRRIIRIPIRLGPGETVDLTEQDVILEDGDIVFIESRDTEVYYTGGLLGGGQFTLPRDYDLNVLQAIAVSQGQRAGSLSGGSRGTSSIGGPSALNSDVAISASRVVILRYLEDGRMVPIEVNLYQARTDVAEQVIIQPGDYILLQYTKLEAFGAFFERHLLEGAFFSIAAAQLNGGGN